MLLLVTLAVGASIVVARSILLARLDERLDRELAQEVSKSGPSPPITGARRTSRCC